MFQGCFENSLDLVAFPGISTSGEPNPMVQGDPSVLDPSPAHPHGECRSMRISAFATRGQRSGGAIRSSSLATHRTGDFVLFQELGLERLT